MFSFTKWVEENYPDIINNPFEDCDVKRIEEDQESAEINLENVVYILDRYAVEYRLIFGTLLGIYRDKSLIPYDIDIDLAIPFEYTEKFSVAMKRLINDYEFRPIRYSKDMVFSFIRNGIYVDIYFFKLNESTYKCGQYEIQQEDYNSYMKLNYRNQKYKTIRNPERFFIEYYGNDWRTPIRGLNANRKNSERNIDG